MNENPYIDLGVEPGQFRQIRTAADGQANKNNVASRTFVHCIRSWNVKDTDLGPILHWEMAKSALLTPGDCFLVLSTFNFQKLALILFEERLLVLSFNWITTYTEVRHEIARPHQ